MLRLILLFSLASYAITADPPTDIGLLIDKIFSDAAVDSTFDNGSDENPCIVGKCVPYYQCSADGKIITDGEGLFDSRQRRKKRLAPDTTEKSPCKSYLEICCSFQSNCGFRNVDGIGFRINSNDSEAKFGEFPWTVGILKEETLSGTVRNVYHCGGSLIHPSVVLTAAYCVSGRESSTLKIRAGEWDTQTRDELLPHQDRQVVEYIIHEKYYKGGLSNNVVLLFLEKPVDIAENVNTICLPPQNATLICNDASPPDGVRIQRNHSLFRCVPLSCNHKRFIAGKDLFGTVGKYQTILKSVELPIVPRDKCLAELRRTRLGAHFELSPSIICAGGELGKDTCKGDGGSPLVCPIPNTENQYYQVGIVSWGIGCNDAVPGIYVNVPLFRNWIAEKLKQKRISTES